MVGRPVLKPGLRRLWRDATTLQIGLDPRRAVMVEDVDSAVGAFLDRLDGTVPADELAPIAVELGLDPEDTDSLVRRLASHGVLDDGSADTRGSRGLSTAERDRIAPDLAAWAIASNEPGRAAAVHAGRRDARVDVHGAGRVGALAAALLTHAGVGTLHVDDPQPLRAGDVPAPWARTAPPDSSAPPRRADVALDVCEQLAPSLRTNRRTPRGRRSRAPAQPSIALIAPVDTAGTVALELRDELLREGVPHLPAYVRETVGVVGPLVVPGRTACLRCVDLSRSERDPAWPHLLAQLCPPPAAVRRPSAPAEPSDGVLATAVAALAATQVLAHLDGHEPSALGASIEIDLVDGLTRRKVWAAHPACGCRWR